MIADSGAVMCPAYVRSAVELAKMVVRGPGSYHYGVHGGHDEHFGVSRSPVPPGRSILLSFALATVFGPPLGPDLVIGWCELRGDRLRQSFRLVNLTSGHNRPGNSGHFVSECNSGKFLRLARKQV